MSEISPCLIGTAFLVAMVAVSVGGKDDVVELKSKLSEQELWIYEQSRTERLRLYITGIGIGTLVGLAFLKYTQDSYNPLTNGCLMSTIVMTTCFFYYMLMPKQYSVINKLDDGHKREVWKKIGRTMQTRYWGGFLLGIIGYMIFGYGLSSRLSE